MGEKKAGNNKISDQIWKLVSVKRMTDEGLPGQKKNMSKEEYDGRPSYHTYKTCKR